MERKGNYIFLTGLLVITLLISVVGTTFSYFGATSRNVKGETTVQFSKGVVGYNEEEVQAGDLIQRRFFFPAQQDQKGQHRRLFR